MFEFFFKRRFTCNVCGSRASIDRHQEFSREGDTCEICHSTVRMRSVVHHLSMALFGRSLPLPKFPERPDISGVGLSDWDEYAKRLAARLDYTNTFYHQEPLLDITNVPDSRIATCDFVISTDVFEHVAPPVSKAFVGARKLLKPGGTLILTIPFMTEETETKEHFPNLYRYEIFDVGAGVFKLVNTTITGQVEEFADLVFHGGPGTTIEMRLFARDAIERELRAAGFAEFRFADEAVPKFGVHWPYPWSVPIVAKAPV